MPAAIPLVVAGISAGASILQTTSANKRAKETQKLIDNYQRQDITNPYENTQISTLGADRQREDLARAIATNAAYAAQGGSRAISALTPQMIAQSNAQEAQIVANLDEQEKQRQQLIARGNEMVQNMTENREANDLAGLGNSLNVARQERTNGVNNLIQTGVSAASMGMEMNRQGMFNGTGNKIAANTGVTQQPTYQAPNSANGVFQVPNIASQYGNPYAVNSNPYAINPLRPFGW